MNNPTQAADVLAHGIAIGASAAVHAGTARPDAAQVATLYTGMIGQARLLGG